MRAHGWKDEIASREAELIELRRDFHRHPELAFAERRTAEIVAERMHRAGLEVETGVAGTGVVAVLRGDRPGRTVAWRADMDALPLVEAVDTPFVSRAPGVMHACGHDGHTAIGIVVAELMAQKRAWLTGTAVFLFQPAEEILGGARRVLESGVLERLGVAEIYGLHLTSRLPVGIVEMVTGVSMASADFIDIEIRGQGGHGASPHQAVDPIAVAAHIVVGLQQIVRATVPAQDAAVLTIGQVIAGSAPNIIPESALLRGSLRTLREQDRRALLERLDGYCGAVAAAHRAQASARRVGACCPTLVNHEQPTARASETLIGELGHAQVCRGEAVLASDDMSLLLEKYPGCFFRVGAAPEGARAAPPPHHSPIFEIGEGSLAVGTRAAATVLWNALAP